jgi:hypothetical protein
MVTHPLEQLYISAVTFAEIRFGIELVADASRRAELNGWLAHKVRPLRKELGETAPAKPVIAPDGYRINVEGEGNSVSILTDPRWAAPLLVLVDAFIASIFSTVASFAIGFLPLPYFIREPLRLVVYLVIFYPVFRTARQVKRSLGADFQPTHDTQPPPTEPVA